MRMNKLAILFLISMSAFSVNAAENFRQVVLPKSVSVHLPKNWIILSDDIMTTIDASAQSISQKMGRVDASTELAFGAGYIFGRQSAALFNIRYYPDLKVSQSMVRGFSGEEIEDFDRSLSEVITTSNKQAGTPVLEWEGTKRIEINGVCALVSEYVRAPTSKRNENFCVRLVRVLDEGRSFTITVSYRIDLNLVLRPICDHIIESIEQAEK
ncbi:hypothetical protein N9V19_02215 [Opitutales bacterium]|jgi:hypothetical protein|nr:hypothetical protein [Opitutales bacterium]